MTKDLGDIYYTYTNLSELLREQRPHEFSLLTNLDAVSFEPWVGPQTGLFPRPTFAMRLYFGNTVSPQPDLRERVYIYIAGNSDDKVV